MSTRIVLLSGPLAVGKTAVSNALSERFGFRKISSSNYLRRVATERGLPQTRQSLQGLGDALDEETAFTWLIDDVATPQVASETAQSDWFVDAVRKPEQVRCFRDKFDDILHVHLTAPEEVLKARFTDRSRDGDDAANAGSYEICVAHPNEQSARSLGPIADLIIDLSVTTPEEAAAAILRYKG